MATPAELVRTAREQLSELTGLELASTLGVTRKEEGWQISLELVEKHSIPEQMDILARYEATLDDDGNLLDFKRRGLRKRVDTEWITEEELAE
ncbi:MAG: gas vesicle protein GvpO [Candidatus Bipolaricaulia bacterium]